MLHNFRILLLILFLLSFQVVLSLKVAFLILGEFRSFYVTKLSYEKYILNAEVNKEHDIDVFVCTYDTTHKADRVPSEYAKLVYQVRGDGWFV